MLKQEFGQIFHGAYVPALFHTFLHPVQARDEVRVKGEGIKFVTDSAGTTYTETDAEEWRGTVHKSGLLTVTVDLTDTPAALKFEVWE